MRVALSVPARSLPRILAPSSNSSAAHLRRPRHTQPDLRGSLAVRCRQRGDLTRIGERHTMYGNGGRRVIVPNLPYKKKTHLSQGVHLGIHQGTRQEPM